jgi:hypothetical protein
MQNVRKIYLNKGNGIRDAVLSKEYLFTSVGRKISIWDNQDFYEVGTLSMPWFSQIENLQITGPYLVAGSHRESDYKLTTSNLTTSHTRNIHKDWFNLKIWEARPPWKLITEKKFKDTYGPIITDESYFYIKAPQASFQIIKHDTKENIGYLPESADYCVAFLCDSKHLYGLFHESLKKKAYIQIWEKPNFKLLKTIELPPGEKYNMTHDTDSLYVAVDDSLRVFKKGTWSQTKMLDQFPSHITGLCIDEKACYASTKAHDVFQVDKKTWKMDKILADIGHSSDLMIKDAQYFIIGGKFDNHISIWKYN